MLCIREGKLPRSCAPQDVMPTRARNLSCEKNHFLNLQKLIGRMCKKLMGGTLLA